jgi:hypothetical protein
MKTRKIELDMDFIGGQGSLTIEEEKARSDFFAQRKMTNKTNIKSKGTGRSKTTA